MIKLSKRNKAYKSYYRNGSSLEKLYNLYLHQTVFDRILDVLVLFAILFTVFNFFLELFLNYDSFILKFFHVLSVWILVVFGFDLIRHYINAKTKSEFLYHHGIDLFLVVFLSVYFLFTTYFGVAWFRTLTGLKNTLYEVKYFRAFLHLFKR
jgi:hypothetical protein